MAKKKKLSLADTQVRLAVPGYDAVHLQPSIEHHIETIRAIGFGEPIMGDVPFTHSFVVTIDVELDSASLPTRAVADALGFETRDAEELGDYQIVVAKAKLGEFPDQVRYRYQWSWFDWLDAIDSEIAEIGEYLDSRDPDDYEADLVGGSLIHVYHVGTHPAFRGQEIGLKLLVHSLWASGTGLNDAATLMACDCPLPWDGREREQTSSRATKLAKLYGRIGFDRIPSRADTYAIMYFPLGRCGFDRLLG